MKAITVRQPWAWAIVAAHKDIENRTWRPNYRGWLAIHAAATVQREWSMPRGVRRARPNELVLGAIVGVARLVDVVDASRSKWYAGDGYGWVLDKPLRLKRPIACKGQLGIWTVTPRVARQIARQAGGLLQPRRAARVRRRRSTAR